jgi:hypothetical protein
MPLEATELRNNGNLLIKMANDIDGTVGAATVKEVVETGPYYWKHSDDGTSGEVATIEEMDAMLNGVPGIMQITEDEYIDLDETEETPTPAATGVDLDSAGFPWDARIHGAKKVKLAKDDTWKKIRNVDTALVEKVEAELRAALAVAPAPVATVEEVVAPAPQTEAPAPAPQLVITPSYVTPSGNFTEEELVVANWTVEQIHALPVAPLELTTTPAPADDGQIEALSNVGMTFPEFMAKVTRETAAGEIDQAAVLAAVNAAGLASLPLLATRPDLIPQIDTALFG